MDIKFWEWYQEKSKENGSLVNASNAARMIGTTRQYIERLCETKVITKHYYQNIPFIGMNDINKEIIKRLKKAQEYVEQEGYVENLLERAQKQEKAENDLEKAKKDLEKTNRNLKKIIKKPPQKD